VSLPAWLQGLPDPERMRATDRWAIEELAIPGLELMERAGRGLADLVVAVAPEGAIAIACGKGNNGGDGYVAARLLREAGRAVRVLAVAPRDELSGDARANAERVDGIEPFAAARLDDCAVAVDALLGTGFSGAPHGAAADAIAALNAAGLPVVAADVPSGIDAATGVAEGGHVLVAGGARGLTGAPSLAAEAAQRAGAGYVTACVPASQQAVLAQRLLEAMTRGLPDDDGAHTPDGVQAVLELAARGGALVVGPGLGRSDGAFAFARDLVARADVAVVLDADGLNAHAGDLGPLAARRAPTILTPHEGELARLLDVDSSAVKARRLEHARAAAERSQATVVLKGDDTLIADPGGLVAVSPGATGALATAGTGDVLSGVLAAVLSRDVDPFMAACAGVRLHARAGIHAAHEKGVDGVIARDVIEALPFAR
jgi:hydroxyethylthiazole kinase-like uncharacterized protein yjeF